MLDDHLPPNNTRVEAIHSVLETRTSDHAKQEIISTKISGHLEIVALKDTWRLCCETWKK